MKYLRIKKRLSLSARGNLDAIKLRWTKSTKLISETNERTKIKIRIKSSRMGKKSKTI